MLRRSFRLANEHMRTLGLPEGTSPSAQEVKQAFREQTKIHHPDVGGDPEHFKRVCNAYNVLSGKAYKTVIDNDFYARAQAKNPHWDYYYGTSRTRDGEASSGNSDDHNTRRAESGGSEHGKHGANWANQQGPYANYSTRDFYRPYESSSAHHGFTDQEIRAALRATMLYKLGKLCKHLFLIGGLIFIYISYRRDRIELNERARREGYNQAFWDIKAADSAKGYDSPLMPSYWERKQREMDEARIADEKRRKAMGIRNPFDASSIPAGPQAVSFRGQPFTAEGLAATRRQRKNANPEKAPVDLSNMDDISIELEDVDK